MIGNLITNLRRKVRKLSPKVAYTVATLIGLIVMFDTLHINGSFTDLVIGLIISNLIMFALRSSGK